MVDTVTVLIATDVAVSSTNNDNTNTQHFTLVQTYRLHVQLTDKHVLVDCLTVARTSYLAAVTDVSLMVVCLSIIFVCTSDVKLSHQTLNGCGWQHPAIELKSEMFVLTIQ